MLTVKGRVKPAKSAWRVRIRTRLTAPNGRNRWVRLADSAKLPKSGRFTVKGPAGGPTATIRWQVRSRSKAIRTGKAFTVRAPAVPQTTTPTRALPAEKGPRADRVTLASGDTLEPGERLKSPNGRFLLTMQEDGNLVLYGDGIALWSSGAGGPGARAQMLTDGDRVITQARSRSSSRRPGTSRAPRSAGPTTATFHHPRGSRDPERIPPPPATGRCPATATAGAFLRSADRRLTMVMQGDGNLVLYRDGPAVWSSGTSGGGLRAVMQYDGNFVVFRGSTPLWAANTSEFDGAFLTLQNDTNAGFTTWAAESGLGLGLHRRHAERQHEPSRRRVPEVRRSPLHDDHAGRTETSWCTAPRRALESGTQGHPGAWAVMQNDGNFVVYQGSTALADTHTNGHAGAILKIQNDANLVVYGPGGALWSWQGGLITPGGGPTNTGPAAAVVAWASGQVGQTYASSGVASQFTDWAPGPFGEWSGDCAKFAYYAWHVAGSTSARQRPRAVLRLQVARPGRHAAGRRTRLLAEHRGPLRAHRDRRRWRRRVHDARHGRDNLPIAQIPGLDVRRVRGLGLA